MQNEARHSDAIKLILLSLLDIGANDAKKLMPYVKIYLSRQSGAWKQSFCMHAAQRGKQFFRDLQAQKGTWRINAVILVDDLGFYQDQLAG